MPNYQMAFLAVLCFLAFAPTKIALAESGDPRPPKIFKPFPEPAEIIEPPWLARCQQAQLETALAYDVFCDFSLTD